MVIDRAILFVTAIGFVSGLLISLQAIGLDYLINKVWMGWGITLKKFAFSLSSLSFLFGLSAFLLLHWAPAQALGVSPAKIIPFFLKTGILISIATPISGQIRAAFSQQADPDEAAPSQK